MGSFSINEFGEAVRTQSSPRKAGAPAPKKKTLADIMKAKRRQANSAKRTAAETQDFLKWALQNCKNQGDLDAIRDLVATNGTAKQRKLFEKLEYDLTHVTGKKKAAISGVVSSLQQNAEARENPPAVAEEAPKAPEEGSKKARRAEIAKQREAKLAHKENFRQAMLNAESVEDLQALEREYGKKFTGSLKSTYNARMHALEKPPVEPPVEPPVKPPVEPPVNKPPKGPKGKGFRLGKGGRALLATLALGLIGGAIAYFTTKNSKKAAPTTPSGEPIKPGFVPADTTKTEKVDTTSAAPVVNPIVEEQNVVSTDTIDAQVVAEIPQDLESGKYIVRKGDNCWNIAKAELIKEKGGEMPTDTEVMERTYKILERNDLHYEADKYTVLIYPNDTLNIKM